MSTFAEEFDRTFRGAKQRVSRHEKKSTGKASNDREGDFVAPNTSFGVSLDDFEAYMPMHAYIFAPTGEIWPVSNVNSRLSPQPLLNSSDRPRRKIKASRWLDKYKPVEQMTWAPGEPKIIEGRLVSDGGWVERPGCRCFNRYRPPTIIQGNPHEAQQWIEHVHRVYGEDAQHIMRWLAHRVQRPQEKLNHALVLGGAQGIGKDTLLEPVKRAVGPWNFCEVSPHHMLGRFNGFVKSVILRINEARDLGDLDRFQFYDHMKGYTAVPPDVLRVDEKNLREYSVPNCLGVVITTNHKTDGIYLPADDRRHFVAWSDLTKEHFDASYWTKLWGWYHRGGFWEIVDSSRAPEDAELADAIEALGSPAALTLVQIASHAVGDFGDWLRDRKNARRIPHRLEACSYVAVRNDGAKDGLWKVGGRRQVIYAKANLSSRDRIAAANDLSW